MDERPAYRMPYLTFYSLRYHRPEWGVHRSIDGRGPVIQVNLGWVGLTIPKRGNANKEQ